MKKVCVLTVGRSDYGIYQPVLRRLEQDPEVDLELIVAGAHLCEVAGCTVQAIERDGYGIAERIPVSLPTDSDSAEGIAVAMGRGVSGFAAAYARLKPDALLVLGDRFEMMAGVVASVPFNIPVCHIHGGELTEGAMDDAFRHAMTKMSHLHFVSTEEYRNRVIQMGEQPERVIVSGAPALDHLSTLKLMERSDLEQALDISLQQPTLLVTFHPVTREYENTGDHMDQLLAALTEYANPVIFTMPNADTSSRLIRERIESYVAEQNNAIIRDNLGALKYFSLLSHCAAMVGNSSSGIIEAASFKLPVVNIGTRQAGRVRAVNVVDVPCERTAISAAIRQVITASFKGKIGDLVNPYQRENASRIIHEGLKGFLRMKNPQQKSFHDIKWNQGGRVS